MLLCITATYDTLNGPSCTYINSIQIIKRFLSKNYVCKRRTSPNHLWNIFLIVSCTGTFHHCPNNPSPGIFPVHSPDWYTLFLLSFYLQTLCVITCEKVINLSKQTFLMCCFWCRAEQKWLPCLGQAKFIRASEFWQPLAQLGKVFSMLLKLKVSHPLDFSQLFKMSVWSLIGSGYIGSAN